jgi:flavin reductase (DIM6/NTAB) family NADH-FMN oxidoreductase RutF
MMKKSLGPQPLIFPTPVFVVGTYSEKGEPNIMAASWAGICCSTPPCVAVSLREATLTHSNITKRQAYTVSLPSEKHLKQTDYVGIFSGRDQDKFTATGLTAVKSEKVDAPYVKEFPLVLECRVIKIVPIGLHTQFIGEIIDVLVDEEALDDLARPAVEKIRPFMFIPGVREYYSTGKRLGNAFSVGRELP